MGITYTDNVSMLSAVSTNTTSAVYDISKRQLVSVQLTASGGSTTFSIDASNDGTNWITSIAFLDAIQTQTATFVTSKTLTSSSGGAIVLANWRFIRVVATVSSGTATAVLQSKG